MAHEWVTSRRSKKNRPQTARKAQTPSRTINERSGTRPPARQTSVAFVKLKPSSSISNSNAQALTQISAFAGSQSGLAYVRTRKQLLRPGAS
jgi:hypothetical protein